MKLTLNSLALLSFPMSQLIGNCCIDWELGVRGGYRQDQFRHTGFDLEVSDQPDFRETFNRINGMQVGGFTKLRFWWIEAGVDADYMWIEHGNIKSTIWAEAIDPSTGEPLFIPSTFTSIPDGDLWDVFLTGGLRLPLYCCEDTAFYVTPLGGYSWHRQSILRECVEPLQTHLGPLTFPSIVTEETILIPDYSERFKRNWRGPFVGGDIRFEICDFGLNGGYSYHWLDLSQTVRVSNAFLGSGTIDMQSFAFLSDFNVTSKFKPNSIPGHRGWLSIEATNACCWTYGLRGTYLRVSTGKKKSRLKNIQTFTLLTPPMDPVVTPSSSTIKSKAMWQTFSISAHIRYAF